MVALLLGVVAFIAPFVVDKKIGRHGDFDISEVPSRYNEYKRDRLAHLMWQGLASEELRW
jgi:hypothetical protein